MTANLPYRARTGVVSADPAMRSIDAAAAKFAAAATSERTRGAYLGGLRDFAAWCSDFDLAPLPALPQTVARYLTDLAERGRSVSTIDQRAAAIAFAHRKAGFDSPTGTEEVRGVLAGIKRTVARRPAKKQALTADLVAKVVKKIPAKDLRGLRDRALILLCFGAALRRSELVALTVDQLDFQRRGLLVRLGRTKTDQNGEGRTVAVPDGKLKVGDAVRAWLDASANLRWARVPRLRQRRDAARPVQRRAVRPHAQGPLRRCRPRPEADRRSLAASGLRDLGRRPRRRPSPHRPPHAPRQARDDAWLHGGRGSVPRERGERLPVIDDLLSWGFGALVLLVIVGLGFAIYDEATAETFDLRKDEWVCTVSHEDIQTTWISGPNNSMQPLITTSTVCDRWERRR